MAWYRGPYGLEWLPNGAQVPQGYQPVQGASQAPEGGNVPQLFQGSTQDLLAKYGIQQAPSAPAAPTPQIPQAQSIPQAAPQAQAPSTPQDPASAALAALKAARASSGLGGTDAQPIDNLIQTLEKGVSLGMDAQSITQAAQAGIGAIDQWQNTDALKVLRGELSGENRRGQLLESVGKTSQGLMLPLESAQEKKDITTQADTQAAEREALRKETLAKIPGLRDQLGEDLLKQQNYAYSQIQPQIEARLNAMGILQSGALPEAQTRAFKDLEMSRQGRLDDFSREATQNLELNLPYASLGQAQGDKQAGLNAGMELSRAGISRMFQENDLAKAYGQQADMSRLALEEARRARDQANKTALWGAGIGAAGQLGAAGTSALMKFSDARLKANISEITKVFDIPIVSYEWNDIAKEMGAPEGERIGVLAQDVEKKYPEAIQELNGYKSVNYSMLPNEITEAIKWHTNSQHQ